MSTNADYLVFQFPGQLPPPATAEMRSLIDVAINDSEALRQVVSAVVSEKVEQSLQVTAEPWFNIALQNGWTSFSTNEFANPAFRRNGLGTVSVRGVVTKTTAPVDNELIFTLPPAFRPSFRLRIPAGDGASLDVVMDGSIRYRVGSLQVPAIATLCGIRFDP